jgi:fatty-acyl-CoA synthase/long-chain acyl-CoA synthetase
VKATRRKVVRKVAHKVTVHEDLAQLRIHVTTMGDLLLSAADRYPDTLALVFPDQSYTYAELARRALRRARSLQALGVRPRDHVGILMHTCAEFVELFFAIALCGGVIVPVNARYKSSELAYVIENGDLATLLTTDSITDQVDFVERLNGALPDLRNQRDPLALRLAAAPRLRNIVVLGKSKPPGCVSAQTFEQAGTAIPERKVHLARLGVRVRDVGLMLYTSGTTANPKGCLITHEAQVRNSIALGRHRYQLTHSDKFWSPLPMFHIASVLPMLAIFDVGGTYLTMGHFDAGVALKMLEKYKVTDLPMFRHADAGSDLSPQLRQDRSVARTPDEFKFCGPAARSCRADHEGYAEGSAGRQFRHDRSGRHRLHRVAGRSGTAAHHASGQAAAGNGAAHH